MAHGRSPTHARKKQRGRATAPTLSTGSLRLQKVLAAAGIASRRGAEELIREGRVSVDGKVATLGDSADPTFETITLDGERVRLERPAYWMLHKPVGVVTSVSDPHGRRTVMHLLPPGLGRVYPVGRLDRDSAGLLLMTNDGALTQQLLHPSHESEKEYRVTVKNEVAEATFARLRKGVYLDDGRTAPARVDSMRYEPANEQTVFRLTITEGRKRQIRRTMLALGHPVKRLVRTRVGPITLGKLAAGASRPLRDDEIRTLKAYAARLKPSRRSAGAGRRTPRGSRA